MSVELVIPCDVQQFYNDTGTTSQTYNGFVGSAGFGGIYNTGDPAITWSVFQPDSVTDLPAYAVFTSKAGQLDFVYCMEDAATFAVNLFHASECNYDYIYIGADIEFAPWVDYSAHPPADTITLSYRLNGISGANQTLTYTRAQLAANNYMMRVRMAVNPKTMSIAQDLVNSQSSFNLAGKSSGSYGTGPFVVRKIKTFVYLKVADADLPKVIPYIDVAARSALATSTVFSESAILDRFDVEPKDTNQTLNDGANIWLWSPLPATIAVPPPVLVDSPVLWYKSKTQFQYYPDQIFTNFSKFVVSTATATYPTVVNIPNQSEYVQEQIANFSASDILLGLSPLATLAGSALYNQAPASTILNPTVKNFAISVQANPKYSFRQRYVFNRVARNRPQYNVPGSFKFGSGLQSGTKPPFTRSRSWLVSGGSKASSLISVQQSGPADFAGMTRNDDPFYLNVSAPTNFVIAPDLYLNNISAQIIFYEEF